jgi:hypothetical protein
MDKIDEKVLASLMMIKNFRFFQSIKSQLAEKSRKNKNKLILSYVNYICYILGMCYLFESMITKYQ